MINKKKLIVMTIFIFLMFSLYLSLGCRRKVKNRNQASDKKNRRIDRENPRVDVRTPQVRDKPSIKENCFFRIDEKGGTFLLRKFCALSQNEQTELNKIVEIIRNQEWRKAEESLSIMAQKKPFSLDVIFLLTLCKEYGEIAETLNKNFIGDGLHTLCETVITTDGVVDYYSSSDLHSPSGTINLAGTWGNAEGSGDMYYELDRVQVLKQTPNAVLVRTSEPEEKTLWMKKRSIYLERFVLESTATGQYVKTLCCFPEFPFTFDATEDSMNLTFYPSYGRIISGMAEFIKGKDWGFFYNLRDKLNDKGHGKLNQYHFAPVIMQLDWGIEVNFDFKKMRFTPVERRHPVRSDKAFTFVDSDYGLPNGAFCGKFPHGPYKMKLCYHRDLTLSRDGQWRAYITAPHDNIY